MVYSTGLSNRLSWVRIPPVSLKQEYDVMVSIVVSKSTCLGPSPGTSAKTPNDGTVDMLVLETSARNSV